MTQAAAIFYFNKNTFISFRLCVPSILHQPLFDWVGFPISDDCKSEAASFFHKLLPVLSVALFQVLLMSSTINITHKLNSLFTWVAYVRQQKNWT